MAYIDANGVMREGKQSSFSPRGLLALLFAFLNGIVHFFQTMNPFATPANQSRIHGPSGSSSGSGGGSGGKRDGQYSRTIGRGMGGGSINQFRPPPPPPGSCPGGQCSM